MEKLHAIGLLLLNFTFLNFLFSIALFPFAIVGRKFISSPNTRSRLFFFSLAAPLFLSAFTVLSSFAPPFFVKVPGKTMFCLNEPYCYIFSFISPDEIPFFDVFLILGAALFVIPMVLAVNRWRSYVRASRLMIKLSEGDIKTDFPGELKKFEDVHRIKVRIIDTQLTVSLMWGYFSNTLILSKGTLNTLSKDELGCLLAHEISHSRRRDNILKELLFLCRNSLFILPHVYYLFRWWKEEIELIGDETAAVETGRPLDVAQAILKSIMPPSSGLTADLSNCASSFSMPHDNHLVSGRIERLVALHDGRIEPSNIRRHILLSETGLLTCMASLFLILFITISEFNPLLVHCYLEKVLSFY